MTRFQMGGYLPLELREGMFYFQGIPGEYIAEVNTGRTAIQYAIHSLGVHKVFVPHYYCPDIISMLRGLDIELLFYHIGEDLLPVGVHDEANAAVILVNYFGVISKKLLQFSEQFTNVIFDQAHSFFTPPVLKDGVMNVYSCRKFFGVCDGAYLIGKNLRRMELQQDVSFHRAIHLLKSIEVGTNGAYAESKYNEQELGKAPLRMSVLTQCILDGIDYASVEAKRRENFQFLHQQLNDIQELDGLEENSVAYMYPLLLNRDIHKELVQEHIYVPLLWSQLMEPEWNGSLEQKYSACIVPLPMDQRYNEKQLEKLVQIIKRYV